MIPTGVGSADITALVAERIVREMLTGIAIRRSRAAAVSRCASSQLPDLDVRTMPALEHVSISRFGNPFMSPRLHEYQ